MDTFGIWKINLLAIVLGMFSDSWFISKTGNYGLIFESNRSSLYQTNYCQSIYE